MSQTYMRQYFTYILASRPKGLIYIGVTSDLPGRLKKHRDKRYRGFTQKLGVNRLVYFEESGSPSKAIHLEKRYKSWRREWKITLIEQKNPKWHNLESNLYRYLSDIPMHPRVQRTRITLP